MRRPCPHCGVDHGALRGVPRLDVAEAAAGRSWLLKAERTSTAETVWYRDRPMRELSKRIEEAYAYVLAAAVRRIERFISEQVVGEAVKLSKARKRFHLLSPQQLALIQEILGEHHAALVAGMIDVEALPPAEAQRLLDRGVVAQDLAMVLAPVVKQDRPPDAMRMIDDAFLYGRDIAKRTQSARREIERLTYAEWKALPREPLTESERAALTWARNSAATKVKGLGNRVASDFATIAIEADRELRVEQERAIREEVAEGIAERKAWRKVASALGDRTGDWSRDLARIAATEQQEAMTEGQAAVMKRRAGGEDVRVAKRPNPDACEACLAAYTQNGRPRIFWLEELRANGSNVGKKRKDWKPTLGPLHPWCACELIEVPDGWGFDEAGDLMPEELLRSALRDLSLRKAARVTHRPRAYGVGSTLSIHVADPELRAVVEDVVRRTPAQVFRPDVGVLLITTDHRRQTTPLDDLDFAYWSGHEIRIQQGIDPARAARVLEHEIAHSLNVWLLRQLGSLDAVRDWHAKLDEVSRDEGRVSDYASREPIENAAEVLRLYLYQRGRLRLRWPRQFAMVHESMRGIWDLPSEGA